MTIGSTMGMRPRDAGIAYAFMLEITDLPATNWREIGGMGIEVQVIDVWESDAMGRPAFMKSPGTAKWQDVTLKRTYYGDNVDLEYRRWVTTAEQGNWAVARKPQGTITLYNTAHEVMAQWTFTNAWPKKYAVSALNAGGNEALTVELTLAIENIERLV